MSSVRSDELSGKTALVTGSSRGIGREFAIGLARMGADVVVNYAGNDEEAAKVQAAIEKLGRRCLLAKTDLTSATCAQELAAIAPRADILVLNASIQYRAGWQDITIQQLDQQLNCNFRSSLLLIQQYVPYMAEQRWGRIITVGSVQEARPHPDMLVYSASKAAQTHMARSLAGQLAPQGVTVNSIAPGVILTDRNTEALANPDYYQSVLKKIPVGFCGETRDCLGALQLLCSEAGRYITGQNLFVDGGMSL